MINLHCNSLLKTPLKLGKKHKIKKYEIWKKMLFDLNFKARFGMYVKSSFYESANKKLLGWGWFLEKNETEFRMNFAATQ